MLGDIPDLDHDPLFACIHRLIQPTRQQRRDLNGVPLCWFSKLVMPVRTYHRDVTVKTELPGHTMKNRFRSGINSPWQMKLEGINTGLCMWIDGTGRLKQGHSIFFNRKGLCRSIDPDSICVF